MSDPTRLADGIGTEADRLRRHLRAMAVVNRQLQAQLTEPSTAPAATGAGGLDLAPRVVVRVSRVVWRRLGPHLPPEMAEVVRKRVKSRLLPAAGGRPPGTGRAGAAGGRTTVGPASSSLLHGLEPGAGGAPARLARRGDGVLFVLDGGGRRRVRSGLLGAALEVTLGEARPLGDEDEALGDGPLVDVLVDPGGNAWVVAGGRRLPVRGLPLPALVGAEDIARFPTGPPVDVAAANRPRWTEGASRPSPHPLARLTRGLAKRARRAFATKPRP